MSENDERLASRGPRGPQGERGLPGLSSPVRVALVFLFALSVVLGGLSLLWTAHEVHASQAAIQAARHREQVSQRQAGAVLSQKLCATFSRLAALKPPAGSAFERSLHDTLDELGPDLGCK